MNLRKCISCGKRSNKFDFVRINKVKKSNSDFSICVTDVGDRHYVEGRTAYLCPCPSCLELAKKKSRIERNFKCRITSQIYDEIEFFVRKNYNEGE